MTEEEMRDESMRILMRFHDIKADSGEGMVILAMALAVTFKEFGVSQHEAISRFTTIVRDIYKS